MSTKTKNTSTGVDVEALVAKTTGLPTASAVSSALAALQKKQEEEEQQRIIRDIARVQKEVKRRVENLQQVRKLEKDAKKELQVVADAEQEFLKTGDFEAFVNALAKNNLHLGW